MRYSPIQNRYLNILLAILLAGLFTFSSLPPSPRALAEAASNVTLTSTAIAAVNGTGTTDLIINGLSGPTGLAAYQVEISFDKAKVRAASVEGYSPFSSVTSNVNSPNPVTDANTLGIVKMNSFHANQTGPTGTLKLATITWRGQAEGTFPLTLTISNLSDVAGNTITGAVPINATITVAAQPGITPVPATPVPATATPAPTTPPPTTPAPATPAATTPAPGTPAPTTPPPATPAPTAGPTTVPIATSTPSSAPTPAGTYVEAGSGTVAPNASVQIPVSVKNITARSGFGSYDFVISFDPRGLKVENIKPGDQPFGDPAASNINNSSGKIFVNDFSDKVPGPTGNVITFYLTVTGLAAGSWPISVTVTTLSAANGDDIVGTVLPGGITVSGAPAPTPAPTVRPTTPPAPPTLAPTAKPTTPSPATKPPTPPATQPPTAPPATTKPATPAPTIAPTPVPTPTPEPGPNVALIVGVIVLVVVVIVVIVLVTRKKPEPPAPPPPPAPKK